MNKLSPGIHGVLDYTTVFFLFFSPVIFRMQDSASTFTVALAVVHFVLTVLTNFQAGVIKIIPLKVHGIIEGLVAIVLIGVAIFFKTSGDNVSFYYYLSFSGVLILVWLLSDYNSAPASVIEPGSKGQIKKL